jgi:hypothetical protein
MKTSESISAISKALAAAQGEITDPSKDSVNPHFKSNYAGLEVVMATIRETLSKHDLFFTQEIKALENGNGLAARIIHGASGEWIEYGALAVPSKDNNDPQKVKSGVTYMRRTQALAIMGLGEADDDGNDAAKAPKKSADKPKDESRDNPPPDNEKRVIGYIERIEQAETMEALDKIAEKIRNDSLSPSDKAEIGRAWSARKGKINE